MAASTPTVSVPSVPVTLRLTSSIVNRATSTMTFDSAQLQASAPARVVALRAMASFALTMSAESSSARSMIRVALQSPNNPASASNMVKGRAALRNIADTLDSIASMFAAVHILMGTEIGKDANRDSVCGRYVLNLLFGTEKVSESRLKVKTLV